MTKGTIKGLRKSIEFVLKNFPQARDSDQWLTLKIWVVYYPSRIKEMEESIDGRVFVRKYVLLNDILELPREDNVKRLRAKIQNEEGKWLPTTWEIAKQRQINESVWRNYAQQN